MQKLLPRGQKDGDHVRIHVHVDVIELHLIVIIGAVADPAHIELRPLPPKQIDRKSVVREHAHLRIRGKHLAQHGKARLF